MFSRVPPPVSKSHHQTPEWRYPSKTIARGQPPRYAGRDENDNDHDDAGNITDNKSGHSSDSRGSDSGSCTSSSDEQEEKDKAWRPRAWNSGSLLVRPGSDRPSGRVPRTTYIYLVGGTGGKDDIEVEVVVGSGGKNRTVLSKSSGTTCVCVPAQETYTVRNLYFGDRKGRIAVLFWTSPSGDGGDLVGCFCSGLIHLFVGRGSKGCYSRSASFAAIFRALVL